MADREVRVRLSVVGSQQFNQQMQGAANAAQGLGKSAGNVDKAGSSLASFAKKAVAVVGVGAAVKSTAKTFGDFQQSLNRFQQVSGATAAQMGQVQIKAREVGKAIAGMSSSDAADAMLELAKGGLTADQAMQAVTGTVQLAAAAQVSAAEAAEIQSKALNTFGLKASDANRVADVLANTANAASGDIGDFAQALQQAGPTAAQLGISIEDTNTALGLFANNGILGSDAGTSLKTMLQRLNPVTDQAQAAMAELGVKAFDANGQFVGLEEVSRQLNAAQSTMTDQQFSAAAAVAFGSDAVRGASVLAKEGADNFAAFGDKVSVAGGASDAAAANTKGLNGAIDAVKASVQDAQIALGEQLAPAAEALGHKLSDLIPILASQLAPALEGIGDAAITGADIAATALGTIVKIATPVIDAIGAIADVFGGLPAPVQTAILALGGLIIMRARLKALSATLNGAFRSATTSAGLFSRQVQFLRFQGLSTLGAAFRVAGSRAKAFGKSLSGAFGGPVGLAILGITTAIAFFAGKSADAEARTQEWNDAVRDLADGLNQANGALTELSTQKIVADFAAVAAEFENTGVSAGQAADAVIAYGNGAPQALNGIRNSLITNLNLLERTRNDTDWAGKAFDSLQYDLRGTGISIDDLATAAVGGNEAIAAMAQKAAETGRVSLPDATAALQEFRSKAESLSPAMRSVNAEADKVAAAQAVVNDRFNAASQAAKTVAGSYSGELSKAMQQAADTGISLQEALAATNIPAAQQAEIIARLGGVYHKGGDGALYFSEKQADAAAAAEASTDATKDAADATKKAADANFEYKDSATIIAEADAEMAANKQAVKDAAKAQADAIKDAEDALKEAQDKLTPFGAASQAAADKQSNLASQADRVTDALNRQKGILPDLNKATFDVNETLDNMSKSLGIGEDDVVNLSYALKKGTSTIDLTQESGRKLFTVVDDLRGKMVDLGTATFDANVKTKGVKGAQGEAAKAMAGVRKEALENLTKIPGMTEKMAKAILDDYGLIPDKISTNITADDKQNKEKAADVRARMHELAKVKAGLTITADPEPAKKAISGVAGTRIPDKSFSVYANDLASGLLKWINAYNLADKTFNVTTNDVHTTLYRYSQVGMPASAMGGPLKGLANGGTPFFSGVVPGPRPAKGTDNFLAWLPGGKPLALAGTEFVVNPQATAKNLGLLTAINSGKLQGAANGALIGRSASAASSSAVSQSVNVQVTLTQAQLQQLGSFMNGASMNLIVGGRSMEGYVTSVVSAQQSSQNKAMAGR